MTRYDILPITIRHNIYITITFETSRLTIAYTYLQLRYATTTYHIDNNHFDKSYHFGING